MLRRPQTTLQMEDLNGTMVAADTSKKDNVTEGGWPQGFGLVTGHGTFLAGLTAAWTLFRVTDLI